MLEFIVLGLVPGTHIQLDFADIVMLTLALITSAHMVMTVYDYHRLMRHYSETALYLTVVKRKHWLTRKLQT